MEWPVALLNGTLVLLYTDHMLHAAKSWYRHRDARSARGAIVAMMLEVLVIATAIRSFGWLAEESERSVYVAALWGMALVGGLFLFASWRRD